MLQNEFYQRTGISLSEEEFNHVNAIYMAADLRTDKDQFCKDWKKHSQSDIINSLHVVSVNRECQLEVLHNERNEIVDLLIQEAHANMSATLKNKAIAMVGHANVIRRMFDLGIDLWPGDKDFIAKNLQNA